MNVSRIYNSFLNICFFVFCKLFNFPIGDLKNIKINQTKDSLLILGSGYSVNDISTDLWSEVESNFNIFSFNQFHIYKNIDVDFYIFEGTKGNVKLQEKILQSIELQFKNKKTIVLFKAVPWLLKNGLKSFIRTNKYFRKKSFNFYWAFMNWGLSYNKKIIHSNSDVFFNQNSATITYILDIALKLKYKKVILTGIDLVGPYFWEPLQNENTEHATYREKGDLGIVNSCCYYRNLFNDLGGELYVVSERSILSQYLPIYQIGKS